MSKVSLDLHLGYVSAYHFLEPKLGIALLASQVRDSFFEIPDEMESGEGPIAYLALVNQFQSPASLFSEKWDSSSNQLQCDDSKFALTILAGPSSMDLLTAFKNMWNQARTESEDFMGGFLTVESVKKSGSALVQIIQVDDWAQLRRHPFQKDAEGMLAEEGMPIVEDFATDDLESLFAILGVK